MQDTINTNSAVTGIANIGLKETAVRPIFSAIFKTSIWHR